jgi:hypothetical protein
LELSEVKVGEKESKMQYLSRLFFGFAMFFVVGMRTTTLIQAVPFSRMARRMGKNPTRGVIKNATRHVHVNPDRKPHPFWIWTRRRMGSSLKSVAEQAATTAEDEDEEDFPKSVHLKLQSETMMARADKTEGDDDEESKTVKRRKSTIFSYTDTKTKQTLEGLNVSRRRFEAWLNYALGGRRISRNLIQEGELEITPDTRERFREKWRERHLLCDRTEVLSVYSSDKHVNGESTKDSKRGGFDDLLHLYADRFHGILVDEKEETRESLHAWLMNEYGVNETQQLSAASFQQQQRPDQVEILQNFLNWFRSQFPYFYDRCDACGASFKDEQQENRNDREEDEGTFLGYIFPTESELSGKTGRTELYQCHKCQSYTRFPRYNKVQAILEERRGRCGEYSMLMYRMLRAVGHEAKWVVDWADHVWAEVLLGDEWIHLDPCEAAVNKPLLYQEWGKQQTYIVGFYTPLPSEEKTTHAIIEDLTTKYTSDDIETIFKRRDETNDEVNRVLSKVADTLWEKIHHLTANE